MRHGWWHVSHWPTELPPFLGPAGAPSFGFSSTIKLHFQWDSQLPKRQDLLFQAGVVGQARALIPLGQPLHRYAQVTKAPERKAQLHVWTKVCVGCRVWAKCRAVTKSSHHVAWHDRGHSDQSLRLHTEQDTL